MSVEFSPDIGVIEPKPLDAEETIRKELERNKTLLLDKRTARDALNAEIRHLVRDVDLLGRALHVFDRARKKEADTAAAVKEVKSDAKAKGERNPA